MVSYPTFAEAEEHAVEGESVCGTFMPNGSPAYFVLPADPTEQLVHATAFQVRNGRPISKYESFLMANAVAMRQASNA